MPLYEYRCRKCDHEFEQMRSLKDRDQDVSCPKCGEPEPERRISACTTKSCSLSRGPVRFG